MDELEKKNFQPQETHNHSMIENINESMNTILMNKAAKIREANNVITKQSHKEIKDNNINDDHNPAYYANMPVQQ
jgi:hypothetical protein